MTRASTQGACNGMLGRIPSKRALSKSLRCGGDAHREQCFVAGTQSHDVAESSSVCCDKPRVRRVEMRERGG